MPNTGWCWYRGLPYPSGSGEADRADSMGSIHSTGELVRWGLGRLFLVGKYGEHGFSALFCQSRLGLQTSGFRIVCDLDFQGINRVIINDSLLTVIDLRNLVFISSRFIKNKVVKLKESKYSCIVCCIDCHAILVQFEGKLSFR